MSDEWAPPGKVGLLTIGSLPARFPGLALAVPPGELRHHRTGSIVRGLVSLPVRL